MKDTKTVSLLFISLIILLTAALILLYLWGYHKFYDKPQVDKPKTEVVKKNTAGNDDTYRDSLQKLYASTINNISNSRSTSLENRDQLHFPSDPGTPELYKLKNEIEAILKNHPLKADLDIAQQKIIELQINLAELHNKNISVEDENKRLNGKLNQLTNEIKSVEQNLKTNKAENKTVTKSTKTPSVFSISQLQVSVLMNNKGAEQETVKADQAEKFTGSFTVKNNLNQFNNAEIIVVVLQPDGRVMQSSWESGTFDTPEGRKIYSSKFHFEYSSGESKRLSFSLSAEKYLKGEYIIQIYYNGMIIGKTFKTLS